MEPLIKILLLLPVAALANWQAVETYHHGSIFARNRAYWEVRGGLVGELLACPFCLSHWTGMVIAVFVFELYPRDTPGLLLLPVYWLAVVRLSQFFNDRFHAYCRTYRENPEMTKALAALQNLREEPDGSATEEVGFPVRPPDAHAGPSDQTGGPDGRSDAGQVDTVGGEGH